MFEAVGCKVVYLKRISFGEITLDKELKEGEYRPLNQKETEYVNKINGLTDSQ
jgi:16S rRNA pseudouridine516 synthase